VNTGQRICNVAAIAYQRRGDHGSYVMESSTAAAFTSHGHGWRGFGIAKSCHPAMTCFDGLGVLNRDRRARRKPSTCQPTRRDRQ
jgi:hypothetical protein